MSAQQITESAKRAWRESLVDVSYEIFLERQKLLGFFWGAL
jgi:hypothetical protein